MIWQKKKKKIIYITHASYIFIYATLKLSYLYKLHSLQENWGFPIVMIAGKKTESVSKKFSNSYPTNYR